MSVDSADMALMVIIWSDGVKFRHLAPS